MSERGQKRKFFDLCKRKFLDIDTSVIIMSTNQERDDVQMAAKMEISVLIKDEEGNEFTRQMMEKDVPSFEDFNRQGFRESFHQLETAIIETRKEVSDSAVSKYLESLSQKKPNQNMEPAQT